MLLILSSLLSVYEALYFATNQTLQSVWDKFLYKSSENMSFLSGTIPNESYKNEMHFGSDFKLTIERSWRILMFICFIHTFYMALSNNLL